ncbi:MAG: substrate-binding domain-containing protein [Verrucomicrobiota bacterium]
MSNKLPLTKHFQISKLLADRIRYMPPGEAIPTMAELTSEFKASQATISLALTRLRNQGIIERPQGRKRLVVAEHNTQSLFKITLLKPLWPSPDYDALLQAIYEAGLAEHWNFNVQTFTDIATVNWTRATGDSDAVILICPAAIPPHLTQPLNSLRKPLVLMRDKPEGVKASFVWVDDRAVGRMATEHLLELGHRRIAVMLSEPVNSSSSQRMMGWRDALKDAGITDVNGLILDCTVRMQADAIKGSYDRLSVLLQQGNVPEFSAVFCVGWTGALAAMRALRETGLDIPRDVSVITYGSEAALWRVPQPAADHGAHGRAGARGRGGAAGAQRADDDQHAARDHPA